MGIARPICLCLRSSRPVFPQCSADPCLGDVSEGKSGVLFETINEEEEGDHLEGLAEQHGIRYVDVPPSFEFNSVDLPHEDHVDDGRSEGYGRRSNETVTLAEIHHHCDDYQGEDRAGLGGLSEGDVRMGQSEDEACDLAEESILGGVPEARDASASPFDAGRPVENGNAGLHSLESSGVTRKEPMLNQDAEANAGEKFTAAGEKFTAGKER